MHDDMSDWPRWPEIDPYTMEAVSASLVARRWSISGPRSTYASSIARAEAEFARLLGRAYCVTTCNGSSAIVIALQALGLGPGNRVLVPATAWVGCATAILRVGATPVFMEGDEISPCMNPALSHGIDPDSIDAILAVHLYASHDDVDRLRRWAPRARIVEDCSHCHGATDERGRMLGTLGDISIFSFQATKILTCGEGGAAVTDDPSLAARLAALRADSRRSPGGTYSDSDLEAAGLVHGANYALSELHAAVLCDQMERLASQSARRARGAEALDAAFQGTPLRIVGDRAALCGGAFYGLLVAGGREIWGPFEDIAHVIRSIEEASGARCRRAYPPVPEGPLYLPETDGLYRIAHDGFSEYPNARRWYRESIVIPHQLMLAAPERLAHFADALVGMAPRTQARFTPTRRRFAPLPSVTVIILTHRRPESLAASLHSISSQDYPSPIRVLVFGDNAPYVDEVTKPFSETMAITSLTVNCRGYSPDQSTFERVAVLRNMALRLVRTQLVCFLDDDNTWRHDHVSSLVETMRSAGTPAAHSWRRLVRDDGTEGIPDDFPWLPPGPGSRGLFETYLAHGVFSREDAIVRDVASLPIDDGDLGMVDLGEWIFERTLLDIVAFDPIMSQADVEGRVGEDDKLLRRLRAIGVPVACSEKPTLNYRLGGFSNARGARMSHDRPE